MDEINYYLNEARKRKNQLQIIMVTNVEGHTVNFEDYETNSLLSEYLSELELEELEDGFKKNGFQTEVYYDEAEFIKHVSTQNSNFSVQDEETIILSMAHKGKKVGRKSLVPSFCDLYNLNYTSSNPYSVSLCRNKFHTGILLRSHNINVPNSWLYTKKGWLFNNKPPLNSKIIVKLNNESASIGLNEDNVFHYKPKYDDKLNNLFEKYGQDLIVQQFIEGYEVEFPLISGKEVTPLLPVGISVNNSQYLGDKILSYDIRAKDGYSFFDFNLQNKGIIPTLEQYNINTALLLGITGFGRIDYRIDNENRVFVTDIATNPHIVKHSSFHYAFKQLGYDYNQMLGTLVGLALEKIKN